MASEEHPSRITEGSPLLAHSSGSNNGALSAAQRNAIATAASARAHRAPRPQLAAAGYPAAAAAGAESALPASHYQGRHHPSMSQEEADAEFARQLAEGDEQEYQRERRRSSDAGAARFPLVGFRGGGIPAPGNAPRAQAFFSIPQLAVVLYYSIRYADKWNSCDRPVNLWLVLYGIKLFSSTVVAGLPLLSRRRWHPRGETYGRLHDTVNLFGFIVFILGNFWVFDSITCRSENPVVFHVAFILVIIQYVVLMLPCVMLMCLAPMVFCCLPLLIRLSLYLPPGVGLRVLEQQGASESLLEKLPPPKRYERGMFQIDAAAGGGGGQEVKPQHDESKQSTMAGGGGSKDGSPSVNHDAPECAICLSNYSPGELVRQLPCAGAHHFHDGCVIPWLKLHATCPCDRESLLPLMADPALMQARVAAQEAAAATAAAAAANAAAQSGSRQQPAAPHADAAAAGAASSSRPEAEHKQHVIDIDQA